MPKAARSVARMASASPWGHKRLFLGESLCEFIIESPTLRFVDVNNKFAQIHCESIVSLTWDSSFSLGVK